jgi:hypothetical protein
VPLAAALDNSTLSVIDADGALLAGPSDLSEAILTHNFSLRTLTGTGGEVPWWSLANGALKARLPAATQGTSMERREALISSWPSARASDPGALPASAGPKEEDQ